MKEHYYVNGLEDGGVGNPIPENASAAYRKGYVSSVGGILASKKNLTFQLIFTLLWGAAVGIYSLHQLESRLNEQHRTKESRIVEFYQKHGPCPSGLSPAGIDERVQLWTDEVDISHSS